MGKFNTGFYMWLTVGGLGVWVLKDLVRIVNGNFTDNGGNFIRQGVPTRSASSAEPEHPTSRSEESTSPRESTDEKTEEVAVKKTSTGNAILGCLVIIIAIVAIIVACAVSISGSSESSDSSGSEDAEDKRKGFHCLSPWDGNHNGLEALIRAELKDPNSMETIETRITPVDANGSHRVILEYRARNSFGGMAQGVALGSVDNDTCRAVLLSIE